MRLRPEASDEVKTHIDLLLPPCSLYVLTGESRYNYTHELLPSGSLFRGVASVERGQRLSVIFRDAKTDPV